MIAKIHTLYAYTAERHIIWIFFTACVGAILVYILLVAATTFNIAAHSTIQKDLHVLNSQIGDLEAEYIILNNSVTRQHAYLLGFQEPRKEIFAFRKRLVQHKEY